MDFESIIRQLGFVLVNERKYKTVWEYPIEGSKDSLRVTEHKPIQGCPGSDWTIAMIKESPYQQRMATDMSRKLWAIQLGQEVPSSLFKTILETAIG